jgi:hypothetical protein
MKDFFISYTKADQAWAEWIAWKLEEAGYSTVIQAWDFRPGSNFVLEMQRAASTAKSWRGQARGALLPRGSLQTFCKGQILSAAAVAHGRLSKLSRQSRTPTASDPIQVPTRSPAGNQYT